MYVAVIFILSNIEYSRCCSFTQNHAGGSDIGKGDEKILSYENQQSSDIKKQETMQVEQTDNSDYKVYGKYKVKSTYSGTDSITDLMMDYASRVASLKY